MTITKKSLLDAWEKSMAAKTVFAESNDSYDVVSHFLKTIPDDEPEKELLHKLCPYCGGPIEIRNPTGMCDHLYYPENCNTTLTSHQPLLSREQLMFIDSLKKEEPECDHQWENSYIFNDIPRGCRVCKKCHKLEIEIKNKEELPGWEKELEEVDVIIPASTLFDIKRHNHLSTKFKKCNSKLLKNFIRAEFIKIGSEIMRHTGEGRELSNDPAQAYSDGVSDVFKRVRDALKKRGVK